MANPAHVDIVKQGVEAIAAWRKKHPNSILDLSEADLQEASLNWADLTEANLGGADLTLANLSNASLSRANLSMTNLREADLRSANLSRAYLIKANLSGTNFTWADLIWANFSWADLRQANLQESSIPYTKFQASYLAETMFDNARMGSAIFSDVDLSEAYGLDRVVHLSPSTIGIDTLYRSRGKIPESFLRDCGVPKDLIAYLPSLVGDAFDFYSCFISYSSRDDEFARRLHSRLQQENLRVWFAPEDIQGGKKIYDQIDHAIRIHDKLLLVLSKRSMQSDWVQTEIRRARQAEKRDNRQKLFPIRLCSLEAVQDWTCFDADTGKDLAVEVREYHIPDFSNWKTHDAFEANFQTLLRDLRCSEEGSGSDSS